MKGNTKSRLCTGKTGYTKLPISCLYINILLSGYAKVTRDSTAPFMCPCCILPSLHLVSLLFTPTFLSMCYMCAILTKVHQLQGGYGSCCLNICVMGVLAPFLHKESTDSDTYLWSNQTCTTEALPPAVSICMKSCTKSKVALLNLESILTSMGLYTTHVWAYIHHIFKAYWIPVSDFHYDTALFILLWTGQLVKTGYSVKWTLFPVA